MKKSILTGIICLFLSITMYALDAHISYATFKGLEGKNYIELYFLVKGNSVEFKQTGYHFRAQVEVVVLFKQGGEIKSFDKYLLKSPDGITKVIPGISLLDMKRMGLPNGEYELEVTLTDVNDPDNKSVYQKDIVLEYGSEEVEISDLQLLEGYAEVEDPSNKYVKHGFFMKPFTYAVYPSFVNELTFFAEIYNTDVALGEDYLIKFALCKEGEQDKPLPTFSGFRKQESKPVNALLMNFDITNLETGNYELVIEVRNQQNEIITNKALKIIRSKPDLQLEEYLAADLENSFTLDMTRDELEKGIGALSPVIDPFYVPLFNEVQKTDNEDDLRKLLHQFYSQKNEIYPEEPYSIYMNKIEKVHEMFGNLNDEGYETDMGYTFLKYGPPSDIADAPMETNTFPYQIWVYYEIAKGERNVKFVFYNPSLAGNNYVLLHSTARDEISDRQWQRKLYKNEPVSNNRDALEGTEVGRFFGGGRAGELFDDY